tara:strand:+ start:20335 stop:21855 length:1521 start_codon:yes stop_codon:yes gene_type:complete
MALRLISKVFERHRGINDLSEIKRIEDDHLFTCENWRFLPAAEGRVQLEMRTGYDEDTMNANLTGGTQIQGVNFTEYTGGEETIFAYNGKLYELAGTPTELATGLTDAMYDFTMLSDTLIMANGSDVMKKKTFGGAIANLGGTPPVAKYVHQWHNFVFTAGTSGTLNRLRWSDLGAPETWPAGNVQDMPFEITGISSLGDVLYVFGKNKFKTVTGFTTSTFVFGEGDDVGCISHYGIVSNGASLFWPAQDGIYALGNVGGTDAIVGGSSLTRLSTEKLRTFWDALNVSSIGQFHGIHDVKNHCVRWTVKRTAGTINDRELIFDYHERVLGFRTTTGINASCYTNGKDSNGNFQVSFGESQTDSNGGVIYKLDASKTDNDTTITATLETKAYDFDSPDIDKYFEGVKILAKGNDSESKLLVSFGVGDFPDYSNEKTITASKLAVYDTAIYDVDIYGEDTFRNYGVGINLLGKSLAVKMVSNENNKSIRVAGWTVQAQPFEPLPENQI